MAAEHLLRASGWLKWHAMGQSCGLLTAAMLVLGMKTVATVKMLELFVQMVRWWWDNTCIMNDFLPNWPRSIRGWSTTRGPKSYDGSQWCTPPQSSHKMEAPQTAASHPALTISTPHWWTPERVKQLSVALLSFVARLGRQSWVANHGLPSIRLWSPDLWSIFDWPGQLGIILSSDYCRWSSVLWCFVATLILHLVSLYSAAQ